MIAMTGSSEAPGDTTHGRRASPATSPDHLLVWLRGHIHTDDDRVIDDRRLGDGFSLSAWVREVRDGYPDAILGATFPSLPMVDGSGRTEAPEDWLELTRTAAGTDAGGDHRSFTGDTTPTSLRALRRWTVSKVQGRGFPVDDVVLAVSELATNVERHGGKWLTVDVVDRGETLVLAVTDPAVERFPEPRDAGPDETAGRGLLVVASLATRWGLIVRSSHKTVWAAFQRST